MTKRGAEAMRSANQKSELKLPPLMLALERRYVFDAALAAEIFDAVHHNPAASDAPGQDPAELGAQIVAAAEQHDAARAAHADERLLDAGHQVGALTEAAVEAHNLTDAGHEVAFVDSRLEDIPAIVSAIPEGIRIVIIDGNSDAVAQMAAALQGDHDISGLHILSHGTSGTLQIGSSTLDAGSMSTTYRDVLSSFKEHLSADADILIYGCDFGAGDVGARASALLSNLTGADIASSDDLTGAADQGGDWDLERSIGRIETIGISAQSYEHILTLGNTTSWTITGLSATNTVQGVSATVTFSPGAGTSFASIANQTFNNLPSAFTNGAELDPSLSFVFNWDTSPESATGLPLPQASSDAGTGTITITFSQPVTNPVIHIDRIGGFGGFQQTDSFGNIIVEENRSNSSLWTLTTPGAALTKVAGVSHFDVTSTTIMRTPNVIVPYTGTSTESGTDGSLNTAAGSVRVNGTFTTITFSVTGTGVEGSGGDGVEIGFVLDGPPNAQNDAFTVNEDATLTGNLFAANGSGADSDPTNDLLTITEINGTSFTVGTPISLANGLLTITDATTGAFTFVPNANYHGSQAFDYTICDPAGGTDTATATISVTAVNDPPVATAGTSSGDEDAPISVGLSGTDIDGTISLVKVTTLPSAAQGILYLADGTTPVAAGAALTPAEAASLVFKPALNFNGTVTVPFTVTDNSGAVSAPANEVITVTPVNDPPVATPGASSGNEDTPIAVDLAGTDVDGTVETVTVTALPSATQGVLYMPDGATPVAANAPLTPAEAATLVFKPALNFNGTVTVPFTVTDDSGAVSAPANEVITVTAVNDPPAAANDSLTVAEDSAATVIDVLGNDGFAPDVGETLTVTAVTQPSHGTVTLVGGVVSYQPDPNYNGPDSFTYTVSDGNGGTATATVDVIVTPVNDPPVGINDVIAVTEDTTAGPVNVLGNDTDIENDPLTIASAAIDTDGDGTPDPLTLGTPTLIKDNTGAPIGTITVASNGSVTFAPAPNYTGPVPDLTYVPNDGTADGSPAMVSFGPITPVNDPPVGINDVIAVTEDTAAGPVNVLGNDTDIENDPLTIASAAIDTDGDGTPDPLTLGTPTLIKDNTGAPIGTITVASNGSVTFAPALNYTGPVPDLTYVPNDGTADGSPAMVSFGPITPVNDAPVATNDNATTLEDTPVTIAVLSNDGDVDNPLDPSSVVITSIPPGASLSPDGKTLIVPGQGKWTVGAGGNITFTPVTNFNGNTTPITYIVKDMSGVASAPASVTVAVVAVNDGPIAVSDKTATESGKPVQVDLLGNDYDPDNDKITVVAASVPANQGVLVNKNGVWTFTAAPNFLGTATITYTIKDSQGATATSTHKVSVTAPALVTSAAVHTATFGQIVTGNVALNDRVVAGSKFSILTPPRVGKIVMQSNGKFTFTPPADFSGSLTFMYRVTDKYGRSVTQVETIRVLSKRHSCLVTFAK